MSKRKALFTRTPRFRPQSCRATAAAEAMFQPFGGGGGGGGVGTLGFGSLGFGRIGILDGCMGLQV